MKEGNLDITVLENVATYLEVCGYGIWSSMEEKDLMFSIDESEAFLAIVNEMQKEFNLNIEEQKPESNKTFHYFYINRDDVLKLNGFVTKALEGAVLYLNSFENKEYGTWEVNLKTNEIYSKDILPPGFNIEEDVLKFKRKLKLELGINDLEIKRSKEWSGSEKFTCILKLKNLLKLNEVDTSEVEINKNTLQKAMAFLNSQVEGMSSYVYGKWQINEEQKAIFLDDFASKKTGKSLKHFSKKIERELGVNVYFSEDGQCASIVDKKDIMELYFKYVEMEEIFELNSSQGKIKDNSPAKEEELSENAQFMDCLLSYLNRASSDLGLVWKEHPEQNLLYSKIKKNMAYESLEQEISRELLGVGVGVQEHEGSVFFYISLDFCVKKFNEVAGDLPQAKKLEVKAADNCNKIESESGKNSPLNLVELLKAAEGSLFSLNTLYGEDVASNKDKSPNSVLSNASVTNKKDVGKAENDVVKPHLISRRNSWVY